MCSSLGFKQVKMHQFHLLNFLVSRRSDEDFKRARAMASDKLKVTLPVICPFRSRFYRYSA